MNFQSLPVVDSSQDMLDKAFNRAKKRASSLLSGQNRNTDKVLLKKKIAHERITIAKENLQKDLQRIIDAFPNFVGLPEFYQELCRTQLDVDALRLALGRLQGVVTQVETFAKSSQGDIRRTHTIDEASKAVRVYYGRVSSALNRLQPALELLEKARRTLTTFPAIKTSLFTVALAGFPNVGKSTLLSKMTPSTPKIAAYAFTTKTLNTGYYFRGHEKVQVVDTPGTLARFEKMNKVEQQAYLCLKYVADVIVFVIDPTETYPYEQQLKLLEELKDHDKQILYYISKTDIAKPVDVKRITDDFAQAVTDPVALQALLENISTDDVL